MVQKLPPDLRQLLLVHLAVRGRDSGVRYQLTDPMGAGINGLHPIVQVEHLPTPAQFPADGLGEDPPIVFHHIGLHGMAVHGCLFDGRHIPDTRHGHVERPGNGRCRQGQHVHRFAHFLEFFFMSYPKTLLLVDDAQP